MGKSRTVILIAACFATLALPALVCLGAALAPVRSGLDLALVLAAAVGWTIALWLVAWWEFTGLFLRWVWAAALVACAAGRVLAPPPGGGALGPSGAVSAAPSL